MKVAIILRKSPTKKPELSLGIQKKIILDRIKTDYKELPNIIIFSDVCKGDDANRKGLNKLFKRINEFERAYCYNVDRFSRSWLGIKWLHEYFSNGCQLQFATGLGNLYNKNGSLNHDIYLQFFILCGFAQYELLRIRSRIKEGIERIKANPKLRKEKYKGGIKGRSWK